MSGFNRRRFLQVASAAGLAPALPAFSAGGAATATSLTNAQKLWISLYANAERTASLPSLTRSMGITTEAAQGIYARMVQTQAITASTTARFARAPSTPAAAPQAASASVQTSTQATDTSGSLGQKIKDVVTNHLDAQDDDSALALEQTDTEDQAET